MADPSEVRAWARSEGLEVSARGAIPSHITEAYEALHANGSAPPADDYPDPGDNAGVTEADFPPPDDDDGAPAKAAPKAERKPRAVRPSRAKGKGWRNVFGGSGPKTKARSGPRTDLSEFAEDTWRDLALLSAGIMPPVSKVLTIQAPYAGEVFDEAVKGLPIVDALVQPVARWSISIRALDGLIGPAFFTTAICTTGEWAINEDKTPALGPDGRPVPTPRTALMLGGLKYSLLQMSRTADLDKVRERAEVDAERMRKVDELVDFIFGFPGPQAQPQPQQQAPQEGPRMPGPGVVLVPTGIYPPPPTMDDTGARA